MQEQQNPWLRHQASLGTRWRADKGASQSTIGPSSKCKALIAQMLEIYPCEHGASISYHNYRLFSIQVQHIKQKWQMKELMHEPWIQWPCRQATQKDWRKQTKPSVPRLIFREHCEVQALPSDLLPPAIHQFIWQYPSVYPSLSRFAEDLTMQGLQWRHLQSARTDHSLLWQKHHPQLHVITNTTEPSEKLSCSFCKSSYKGSFERRAVIFRLPQFGGLWCKRYLFGVKGSGCKLLPV